MKSIKNEFPWGTIEWLANDEVGNSRELSLARMTLPPAKATDTHIHANCEESIYVVRGEVGTGPPFRQTAPPGDTSSRTSSEKLASGERTVS